MNAKYRVLLFGMCLSWLCAGQNPASTSSVTSSRNAKIDDFAFISGHNRGEMDGGVIDEHWSEPAGDTLIGMFRYIKNGKVQRYEFLSIESSREGPVLRVKHFSPGLIGVEDKNQSTSYVLVSLKPGEAIFHRSDKAERIIFRSTSKDTLEVTREQSGEKSQLFQYAHGNE